MTARVTVCERADGSFEIYINEAGRDLLVKELQALDKRWDHFHLDHYDDPEMAFATDVALAAIPYNDGDRTFRTGKVLLRPDDWDAEHFPHVLPVTPSSERRSRPLPANIEHRNLSPCGAIRPLSRG